MKRASAAGEGASDQLGSRLLVGELLEGDLRDVGRIGGAVFVVGWGRDVIA